MQPANMTKAVIWDMDGIIADTAICHFKAWQEVLAKKGITYTEEMFRRYFGQRNVDIIRKLLGKDADPNVVETISNEKETNFLRKIEENVRAFPGAVDLMKALSSNDIKMALASSAPIENIKLITKSLNIGDCFQAIVSGKDVTEGKPNPQVFLLAAQKLGIEPQNCVVIEDALAGVAAAKNAGMHCLAVTNTNTRESLLEADLIVDTLESVTVSDIENLLSN